MRKEIAEKFGNALRVRVCGILIEQQKVLMVRHKGLSSAGYLWAPPGGGMEYGESAVDTLKREFQEETRLQVDVEEFLFINEFRDEPLHALELFYKVRNKGGTPVIGVDPELKEDRQIIDNVRFFAKKDLELQKGSITLCFP